MLNLKKRTTTKSVATQLDLFNLAPRYHLSTESSSIAVFDDGRGRPPSPKMASRTGNVVHRGCPND